MNEIIYFGAAIVGCAGGVVIGYLIREAQYWREVASHYKSMRHGCQIR